MKDYKVPIQSLIDHIKTAIEKEFMSDEVHETAKMFRRKGGEVE